MIPEQLAPLASRLRRLMPERRTESTLTWPDDVRLTHLHPVKAWHGGNVVNKGGRVVLRGELDGKPIKLYEAWSSDHAAFIAALSASDVGALFPPVLAHNGRCVVAGWIEGEPPPDDVSLEALVGIQMRIHAMGAAALPAPGYDFWADFLRPRFVRAAEMLAAPIDDVVELVDAEMSRPASARVLIHPDLRPVNLILEAGGGWVIIDNESVTTSTFPLLDVAHTAHGLSRRAQAYWQAYCSAAGTPPPGQMSALHAAWLARIVGSHFVAGLPGRAAEAMQRYRSGTNVLPFDPLRRT